jgi:hypothetical protein
MFQKGKDASFVWVKQFLVRRKNVMDNKKYDHPTTSRNNQDVE